MRRSWKTAAACALLAAATLPAAAADDYPTRPIRLIVPFPPGGANDIVGRMVMAPMSERLGQQVVIDNRGGANAIIGSEIAARATPDGYTILIVPAGHSINPSVARKLPYDSVKDFAPIGLIGAGAYVLVVNQSVPAKDVRSFVAWVKARPGQVNHASSGIGNLTHLCAELFKVAAKVDMVNVAYKGGGPSLTALISNQVQAFFATVASSERFIHAGKIRALGVTTEQRTPALPDVPTIAESGVPGYAVDGWYGLLAPRGTPPAVIKRLNAELAAVLSDAGMRKRLLASGVEAKSSTPEAFMALIERDIAKWAKVVKDSNLKFH